MCFVAQRFGWLKPAAARMAALRSIGTLRDFNSGVLTLALSRQRSPQQGEGRDGPE